MAPRAYAPNIPADVPEEYGDYSLLSEYVGKVPAPPVNLTIIGAMTNSFEATKALHDHLGYFNVVMEITRRCTHEDAKTALALYQADHEGLLQRIALLQDPTSKLAEGKANSHDSSERKHKPKVPEPAACDIFGTQVDNYLKMK